MPKFSAKVMVVWRDASNQNRSQIINVDVKAENRARAESLTYAEAEEWLKMTDQPGGCEIRSIKEDKSS